MADKLDVKVTGKSIFQVAHEMAYQLLTHVEDKNLKGVGRKAYLQAHYDCLMVLHGNHPD
jgi:hypothetical protein